MRSSLFFSLVFCICCSCNLSIEESIEGVYVTNYKDSFLAEMPQGRDTLILFSDFTFKSSFYGNGTFTTKDNSLKLSLSNSSSVQFPIELSRKGGVKLMINYDSNHHYNKISD